MMSPSQQKFENSFLRKASRDVKKLKNNRSSVTHDKNNINKRRVTVKRGIFPIMIRSKCIKRQLFNQNHNGTAISSCSSDGIQPELLLNLPRVAQARKSRTTTTDDSSITPRRSHATKKKKEVVMSDSPPFLLHTNRSSFLERADINESLEEPQVTPKPPEDTAAIRKADKFSRNFWTLSDVENDRTKGRGRHGLLKKETEEDINKREYADMKWKVAQVESCTPNEAELIYWYQELAESIKRVVIVEREKNFENFPDALETVKSKLHKLKLRRCKETSRHPDDNVKFSSYDADMFTPEKDVQDDDCIPMNVDESIRTPLFHTRCPLNADENERLTSSTSSSLKSGVEDDLSPIFNFNRKVAQKASNFKHVNDGNNQKNDSLPSVVIRKVDQEPAVNVVQKTNWITSESSFDVRQARADFLPGDTIDQNAGLAGVEYLKNITRNKRKESGRQIGNQYDKDWWNASSLVNEDRDGDRRFIGDSILQWKNPFPLPEVITNSDVKFNLPRRASQQENNKDLLSSVSKLFTNFDRIDDGDESFHFGEETRPQRTKYRSFRLDGYDDEDNDSPIFTLPL